MTFISKVYSRNYEIDKSTFGIKLTDTTGVIYSIRH